MKELFMEKYFPYGGNYEDLEREFLINDTLAEEEYYLQYNKLKNELNHESKIELSDGREKETRIEINKEELINSQ